MRALLIFIFKEMVMKLMWLKISIGLIIIAIWLFFSRVRIEISYKREEGNDKGEVKVIGLGGLFRYRINIPSVDFKSVDKGVKVEKSAKTTAMPVEEKGTFITMEKIDLLYTKYEELLHSVSHLQENLRWFMARITCETWTWRTTVGTGDAAEAGVLTGIVWAVKANVLGFISHYIAWSDSPYLEVVPQFQQVVFHTYYEGVFSFRLGNVIRFAIRLWIRFRKDKKRNWQKSNPLST
jgi:hypothetical protein